ncbi:hypothetical protein [Larkinella rosea]|uniref:Uncharacterized protein n=1 Tax=Larkinella rosea TaxID=2025312 RepID=A0A3P1BID7_9BACT|nr:hypothetical protein [Larkinella rosea]RRB00841.1 hypothetical protein EHT25_21850 [Larkinella rosea]
MKRFISFGLFVVLLYHMLGHLLVLFSVQWQEQHELSERLTVFSSVDHIVEFQIPLQKHPNEAILTQHKPEGFKYRGSYYEIVNLDVTGDTLHISGYVNKTKSFFQRDLLSFVKEQFATGTSETAKKANNLLKLFLKEYSPISRARIWFFLYNWTEEKVRIPSFISYLSSRSLPVFSPPPESLA